MGRPDIPEPPEYICKPRQTTYNHLPLFAIDQRAGVALTDAGELIDLELLTNMLPTMDSAVIAGNRVQDYVAELQERFPVGFQYRAQTKEPQRYAPDSETQARTATVLVQYFGWKDLQNDHRYLNHHIALDPVTFYTNNNIDLWEAMGLAKDSP